MPGCSDIICGIEGFFFWKEMCRKTSSQPFYPICYELTQNQCGCQVALNMGILDSCEIFYLEPCQETLRTYYVVWSWGRPWCPEWISYYSRQILKLTSSNSVLIHTHLAFSLCCVSLHSTTPTTGWGCGSVDLTTASLSVFFTYIFRVRG